MKIRRYPKKGVERLFTVTEHSFLNAYPKKGVESSTSKPVPRPPGSAGYPKKGVESGADVFERFVENGLVSQEGS